MISRWRKPFAWYLAMALLVGATGYVGLQSEVLEEVYAASVGEAKADAPMMSPIFAEKLEASIGVFDNPGYFYTGVPQDQSDQFEQFEDAVFFISFSWSACLLSACALSGCIYSGCVGSVCLGTVCVSSTCGGSGCVGSQCVVSQCVGSSCFGSECTSSTCTGSGCTNSGCTQSNCANSGCPRCN